MLRRPALSVMRPAWAPRPAARILSLNRIIRLNSTAPSNPSASDTLSPSPDASASSTAVSIQPAPPPFAPRKSGAFYISNVFPIRLSQWDPRPTWAVAREEALMEQLNDIGMQVQGHGFRIESWEIARKDGGVFLHYSYIPPDPKTLPKIKAGEDVSYISALPDTGADSAAATAHPISAATTSESSGEGKAAQGASPAGLAGGEEEKTMTEEELQREAAAQALAASPGRLFLPQLMASAEARGGFPSWLGQWWANFGSQKDSIPGHTVWSRGGNRYAQLKSVGEDEEENVVKGSGSGMSSVQAAAGGGRVWVVKGRQWIEDMNRPTANKLRVEFDGPDVSQEMLYTLFRPYGRVSDITPPAPVPAGSLRFAVVAFSRLTPATVALNCLHGFSTPTNTADYTLRRSGSQSSTIPMSRLRLYYQHPLKAHAIRDWISGHPRLVLPVLAFLLGTLSYTFFDPIRAFFVRSKLEGTFDLEQYGPIKWIKQQLGFVGDSFDFLRGKSGPTQSVMSVGQNAWEDRIAAEKEVDRWLSEYPSTFITVTGPPGSGKVSLVNRVLKKMQKPSLMIDCAEIAKAKNDAGLISALADETGYYPVFSFLSSLNGLIDLAAVGLIGQKAGFSTPIDQQLRQVLETVAGALKDVSAHIEQSHQDEMDVQQRGAAVKLEQEKRRQLIIRGGWHDGRLDCIAGNGVMSELGLGDEPVWEGDLDAKPPALMDDIAPIAGEAVPPTSSSLREALPTLPAPVVKDVQLDADSEHIKALPIVVLKNFATKSAKGDAWNVIAEWGASLIENRIAHVIVITEGPTATKALVRAQPAKPLNSVALADADEANSLLYVQDKLSGTASASANSNGLLDGAITIVPKGGLSVEDRECVAKLGGRMVDLETLVYKVRTGSTVKEAVEDIVLRNTIELRKAAFGDDVEDAKNLPWTRAQAWKVVSELAKSGQLPYAKVLQEFPFKGAEQSLKSMEEHELISVTYHEGRASRIRPGKPVFRYAFAALVNDPIFRASSKIEYNATLIAKAEAEIKAAEGELATLQGITANGGDQALGVPDGGWLGLGKSSAIKERARYLLDKMKGNVEKLEGLEKESAEMLKSLSAK